MKKKYSTLLFDLDGTLTDSAEGIIHSVQYALRTLGEPVLEDKAYRCFIGPPLTESFSVYSGFDAEKTKKAIALFRQNYEAGGKFENRVYDGVFDMLAKLHASGFSLMVATSKNRYFAQQILSHFSLLPYFDYVSASDDVTLRTKTDVIRDILHRFSLLAGSVLMIGDRSQDIEGASACGVDSLGVLYGYGSEQELSGATYLARIPQEIISMVDFQ